MANRLLRGGAFASEVSTESAIGPNSRLRTRTLRWCNTPLINWSSPITNLRDAEIVLGKDLLKRLSIVAAIRDFFMPSTVVGSYSRDGLWKHSIAVGFVSNLIARICNVPEQEDIFLAGVIHDLGLLALESLLPDEFATLVGSIDKNTTESNLEASLIGASHEDIGGLILTHWGFPPSIVTITRFHRRPLESKGMQERDAVFCVAIANYLCSRSGITALGVHNVPPPADEIFSQLGIDSDILRIIWDKLADTLKKIDKIT